MRSLKNKMKTEDVKLEEIKKNYKQIKPCDLK